MTRERTEGERPQVTCVRREKDDGKETCVRGKGEREVLMTFSSDECFWCPT